MLFSYLARTHFHPPWVTFSCCASWWQNFPFWKCRVGWVPGLLPHRNRPATWLCVGSPPLGLQASNECMQSFWNVPKAEDGLLFPVGGQSRSGSVFPFLCSQIQRQKEQGSIRDHRFLQESPSFNSSLPQDLPFFHFVEIRLKYSEKYQFHSLFKGYTTFLIANGYIFSSIKTPPYFECWLPIQVQCPFLKQVLWWF